MIRFSPPYITQEIIDEVTDTLRSGWITTGPKTKNFEKQLAAYTRAHAILCISSATAGLELMLRWFGVKAGDEVIVPAYTYSATANVIVHCGATPVFVDVDAHFNIDPEKIRQKISARTKVIMPVDFAGIPCAYEKIHSIVQESKHLFQAESPEQEQLGRILVLSDAAHSFGAEVNGVKAGMLTDLTVFSFHAVKNLTTAEGGALVFNLPPPFNNQALYESFCVTILHGQNKDALAKTIPGNWKYDIVEAGYKMNMTDIHASIGLIQLKHYESLILPARKKICDAYDHAFRKTDWALTPELAGTNWRSSWHLYPLRIKGFTEQQRDEIIARIFKAGVSVNVHFIPVPMTSYYRSLGYRLEDYPESHQRYTCEISLPVYPGLTDTEIQTVIDAVTRAVESVRSETLSNG